MKNQSVQALLEDIRFVSEQNYEIVESVRALHKPWGQVVSYVRCPDGTLVEICSPVGG
jgi:hypothetical protein